ncbi:MAG: GH25 family lysozyme, partial [Eubacterium sp.]
MKKHIKILSLVFSFVILLSSAFSIPFTSFADSNYLLGVDVSENNDTVDFASLKAQGYDFAMIRLGYYNHLDKKFYEHVQAACEAGMIFGVYLYSYAFNLDEAKAESDFVLDTLATLESKYLQNMILPVGYDIEDKLILDNCAGNKTQITNQALQFCSDISSAGYTPMVYANLNWFNNYIDISQINSKGIKVWYANWESAPDFSTVKSVGASGVSSYIWQYTSGENQADGLDKNIFYLDYSLISSNVILSASSYTYNGTAKKPAVTVKYGTATLKNGTDYTVAYSNNINAGTATVTVTGIGGYKATVKKSFVINKKSLASSATVTLSSTSYTYSASAKKPKVTV